MKPGGTFYVAEFHPVSYVFDNDRGVTGLHLRYSYFQGAAPLRFEPDGSGSYADPSATVTTDEYVWTHGLGNIVSSLISAGLRLDFLHEFPYSVDQHLPLMEKGQDGYWRLPGDKENAIPLMFSIRATKS